MIRYCSAGHERLIVWRRESGRCEIIDPGGVALGILPDIESKITEHTLRLEAGDKLVLYTDGATDALNEGEERFGLERLAELLRAAPASGAEETLRALQAGLNRHVGRKPLFDDADADRSAKE